MSSEAFVRRIEVLIQEYGVAEDRQIWADGRCYEFEADSSPSAFSFFRRAYGGASWAEEYDLDQLKTVAIDQAGDYELLPPSPQRQNRLYAISHSWSSGPCQNRSRLSGDVDFNFKGEESSAGSKDWENKYAHYHVIADDDDELVSMLNACREMHHAHINLSLMQSWGNLQCVKGTPMEKDLGNGENQDFFSCPLDRPDTLIWKLDEFYRTDFSCRNQSDVIRWTKCNKQHLREYLDQFEDVYDYCAKVYLLRGESGRRLVDKLIKNGKNAIVTKDDLKRFMELALEFWTEKARNL